MASGPGRPASNAGDAIGDSSTLKSSCPSLGRSPKGASRVAATTAITRVPPSCSVALLSSSENCSVGAFWLFAGLMRSGRRVG
jgi:hypothetical protein